mmetsp:Transcript_28826/g.65450  ORF Transcript_28826/g.65450 Transcript_28826/m.65450 type:complete len:220 (-) Transcript_28826:195-854(-)
MTRAASNTRTQVCPDGSGDPRGTPRCSTPRPSGTPAWRRNFAAWPCDVFRSRLSCGLSSGLLSLSSGSWLLRLTGSWRRRKLGRRRSAAWLQSQMPAGLEAVAISSRGTTTPSAAARSSLTTATRLGTLHQGRTTSRPQRTTKHKIQLAEAIPDCSIPALESTNFKPISPSCSAQSAMASSSDKRGASLRPSSQRRRRSRLRRSLLRRAGGWVDRTRIR